MTDQNFHDSIFPIQAFLITVNATFYIYHATYKSTFILKRWYT